ncbi:zinc finger HIT domain-containing protein 3 [Discoglossus pictus]
MLHSVLYPERGEKEQREMPSCCVCAGETPKYRCPGCRARYCSVSCCKKHKEECALKAAPVTPANISPTARGAQSLPTRVDEFIDKDDESDRVPEERLKLLDESKELQDLLLNPHLRQLLTTLDCSGEREAVMKKCMQEPLFVEFADRCLSIVEPDEKENTFPE